MMKHENHIGTVYTKDKGWFWFGLTVVIQILCIVVSYLVINISL
ncbi:KGW motif small protein [Acinetobacter sp. VNH17]|uniref:KGW motif small protein n=1 Tax=Acinetobacter thutiue TaxID=2998078 RepID=A0ABT7WIW2_9GAMM|nr:KGW motif small protein [Acinetobacter thutiue]MCY6410528.1 KGW motif small protein [Acinetobacter thutiue]MDN0012629.1 KGW motif small protein [Acinetobacter thutiue]